MDKPQFDFSRGTDVLITDALQLGDVLSQVLAYTGPAHLVISTFSSGEEFLRKLTLMRERGEVLSAELYTDFRASEKTARVHQLMRSAFNVVHLCKNHSKILIACTPDPDRQVCIFTSQNQTRGNRTESYVAFTAADVCLFALARLQNLKEYALWTENT